MNISTLILIHTPLIIFIFCLFSYGKSLLDKNLINNNKEKIIEEGIVVPSFEFNISKSTIGLLLITLSVVLLMFTTNSILKNVNKNIFFVKKTFIIDNNLSSINRSVNLVLEKQLQIDLSKFILNIKHKDDENESE